LKKNALLSTGACERAENARKEEKLGLSSVEASPEKRSECPDSLGILYFAEAGEEKKDRAAQFPTRGGGRGVANHLNEKNAPSIRA